MPDSQSSIVAGGVALVLGGCCSNAWSLERLLIDNPRVGTAVTFCQIVFIVLQSLPSFVIFTPFPRFRPRTVPLSTWLLHVCLFSATSTLNNWAFAYRVPLTLQILFRSGGLAVSMTLGYLVNKQRYSALQISSVVFVTAGVIVATLSRPSPPPSSANGGLPRKSGEDLYHYLLGISMLSIATIITGVQGLFQERTYKAYGKHAWREGIFYTHLMSLPVFSIFLPDIKRGFHHLSHAPATISIGQPFTKTPIASISPLFVALFINMFSQSFCVAGANYLASNASNITTSLVLTIRKAVSLGISMWYFGHGLNRGLASGAAMVLVGTMLYGYAGQPAPAPPAPKALPATQQKVTGHSSIADTLIRPAVSLGSEQEVPSLRRRIGNPTFTNATS